LRLLLDEMYAGLKEYFEILGWDVLTVQDVGLQGAKDKEVVEYARDNNLLLVTQDQKPADLADLMNVRHVLISNATIAKIADAKIREKYPYLPVILITGYVDEMDASLKKGLELNAFAYLYKPLEMEKLFSLLEEINRKKLRDALGER